MKKSGTAPALAALAAGTALAALTLVGPASAQSNGPIKIGVIAETSADQRRHRSPTAPSSPPTRSTPPAA